MIVLNPVNGNLYVVWREFGQSGLADRILMATSTNAARTFSKVSEVASLGVPQPPANYSWPSPVSTAFDQTTLPNNNITDVRMARTNGYPSACVGSDGVLRVAYSKRIPQPGAPAGRSEFARIIFATLSGSNWSSAAIDNHAGPGHQFQPAIACTGTRATAIWYDQRGDAAFSQPLLPWVFFPFIIDPMAPPPAHTIDVRAVQTNAAGTFEPGSSIQVSKYPLAYDTASQQFVQLQYNFLNWALFGGGVVPFLGDYLEAVPKNPFTPPLCANAACTQMTGLGLQHLRQRVAARPRAVDRQPRRAADLGRRRVDRLDQLRGAGRRCVHAHVADLDSQPEPLHVAPRRRVRAAGGGQRAAHEGSREARICRAAAEPRAAGFGPERHAQEALQADVRRAERGSVVQLRHRLHQSIGRGVPCHLWPRGQPGREYHLRRRAVRIGAVRTVFVRKDSTAPVVVSARKCAPSRTTARPFRSTAARCLPRRARCSPADRRAA